MTRTYTMPSTFTPASRLTPKTPIGTTHIETRTERVRRLLQDRAHHIEFNGFLTNHVKHAVIALDGLGASAERIEGFFDDHAAETPYGFGLEPARRANTTLIADDWRGHRGQRQDYEALRSFFAAEARRLGLATTLERYVPELMSGFCGALFHGTIHLGWALDAGNEAMVIEGLAYLAYTWVSSHPERPQRKVDDADVWTTVHRIAAEGAHLSAWVEDTKAQPRLSPEAGFQNQLVGTGTQRVIAQVFERGHALVDLAPAWLDELPMPELWRQLHEAATFIYLAEPADFVLVHIITALHAMEHISAALPAPLRREVARHGWRAVVGVLLTRGKFAAPETLETLRTRYAATTAEPNDWQPVVARALVEAEEHNVKLVYVQQRHWERDGRRRLYLDAAARFITTPAGVPRYSRSGVGFEI